MEVVQTRLAVSQPGTYRGIADALGKIVRLEGPRALFRGFVPTIIGILPYAGARTVMTVSSQSTCRAYNPAVVAGPTRSGHALSAMLTGNTRRAEKRSSGARKQGVLN